MDFDSNLAMMELFNEFKNEMYDKLKEDLFNRYSSDSNTLQEMINYLYSNDIQETDPHIQLDLDYFLSFLSTIKDEKVLQKIQDKENRELIILKLAKLKLTILSSFKNIEDHISPVEDEIKRIQAKKYITTKELKVMCGKMTYETQKRRRARLYDPLPHFKEGRSILYEREKVEEWLKNQD